MSSLDQLVRELFVLPRPEEGIFMNSGATHPSFADDWVEKEYKRLRVLGPQRRDAYNELDTKLRQLVAKLFGGTADDVFFGANTTEVLNTVLKSVHASLGDELVIIASKDAYASLPIAAYNAVGKRVHWVEGNTSAYISAIHEAETPALVLFEGQQYRTGGRYDHKAIIEAATARNFQVVIDIAQWPSPDVRASDNVSLVFTGQKWCGGVHGIAIGILPGLFRAKPIYPRGWGSLKAWKLPVDVDSLSLSLKSTAEALDYSGGGKNWFGFFLLYQGLQFLETYSREAIETHVLFLSDLLREELITANVPVLHVDISSANVAVEASGATYNQLKEVICTFALDRIRFSLGPWNSEAEVRRVADCVRRVFNAR